MQPTQTVNESSAKCADYNNANRTLIEAGIMLAKQPTPEILKQEEKQLQQKKAEEAKHQALTVQSARLWTAVVAALPPETQALVKSKSQTGSQLCQDIPAFNKHFIHFTANVEEHTPWNNWRHAGPTYCRVVIEPPYESGSKRIFKLDGYADWDKDVKKVKKIAEALHETLNICCFRAEREDSKVKQQHTSTKMLTSHKQLFAKFDINYSSQLKVLENGKVSCTIPFVGTPEQLEQITAILGK